MASGVTRSPRVTGNGVPDDEPDELDEELLDDEELDEEEDEELLDELDDDELLEDEPPEPPLEPPPQAARLATARVSSTAVMDFMEIPCACQGNCFNSLFFLHTLFFCGKVACDS